MRIRVVVATVTVLAWVGVAPVAQAAPLKMEYVKTTQLAPGTTVSGHRVGGLSGIDYDARSGELWAETDDKGDYGPARVYHFPASEVLSGTGIHPVEVRLQGLAQGTYDIESLRLLPDGNLLVSSEGLASSKSQPFVREYTRAGAPVRDVPVPPEFAPDFAHHGIRSNLGFEGASVSGGTTSLLAESALAQDGPIAAPGVPSRARLVQIHPRGGLDEYVYRSDPVPAGASGDSGNSELLALNSTDYLVLERGFDPKTKRNHVRVYWTTTRGAQRVAAGTEKLSGTERAMDKQLVFDFAKLPDNPDNVEGMAFGPRLPDGRRSLILVSDDNFSASQKTLFHVLAIG
ncbi:esterase-like activity of phytase family protein [Tsukamurella sp. 8F]|uniref:esterase-like activity of phytase family protein n=1 Tax=unclassified Tsukamurella TaxID=2633480 RepID=UPI0023B9D0A2|nr:MULTISPECIES: esterase-like activity of phytase family protein [unclassified Tsukamurella]MDF0529893.1 esterase-like activity of phytase family protein [Tsukamurella sp. 8J]MDF0588652.1 esterase-like activity of phytase family protein [Tsukamurella sp. 8F]